MEDRNVWGNALQIPTEKKKRVVDAQSKIEDRRLEESRPNNQRSQPKKQDQSKLSTPEGKTSSRSCRIEGNSGLGPRRYFFSSLRGEGIGGDFADKGFLIHPNEKSCRERRNAEGGKKERSED